MKSGLLLDLRLHEQVEIGRVHIRVTEDAVFGQGGKGRGQTGLAGAALAADNNYFPYHLAAPRSIMASISANSRRNFGSHSGSASTMVSPRE